MANTEYISVCDRCGRKTWYEKEQQCHMTYPKGRTCDLGHWHEDEPQKMERCKGTLRIIDNSNLDTRLTPYFKAGERVEIEYQDGSKERCWIGKSTGWKPIYLAISRTDSTGGAAILSSFIKSVRGLNRYK